MARVDHSVTDRGHQIEGFDGLRACAAILVVAYHASNITGASSAGGLGPVISGLKAGVAIFFVISGFLLYLPYARAIAAGNARPDWRAFAGRRAVRILPAYWVALTLLTASSLVSGVVGPGWWRYYGLVQIYDGATLLQGLGVAWSLSVEVSFYLLLPGFAWAMHRLYGRRSAAGVARRQLLVLAGLALASLVLRAVWTGSVLAPVGDQHLPLATSIVGTADWFALGMALAVLRAGWEMGSSLAPGLRALAARPGHCWLLAGLAYTAGLPAEQGDLFLPSYGLAAHAAIGLAAALFVLPAVMPAQGARPAGPRILLSSRPLAWMGTISYGIYLWHVPVRDLVDKWLGAPQGALAFVTLFTLTLAGGMCLGSASWYLVERPAQGWAKHRTRPAQLHERAALGSAPT